MKNLVFYCAVAVSLLLLAVAVLWSPVMEEGGDVPVAAQSALGEPTESGEVLTQPSLDGGTRRDVAVLSPPPDAVGPVCQGSLRGLNPEAPWTTQLTIQFSGFRRGTEERVSTALQCVPDAIGRFSFVVPAKVTRWTSLIVLIEGDDPAYIQLSERHESSSFSGSVFGRGRICNLTVKQAVALRGRIVSEKGEAVRGTAVWVFSAPNGRPEGSALHRLTTDVEGRFSHRVPLGASLALIGALDPEVWGLTGNSDRFLPVSAVVLDCRETSSDLQDLVLTEPAYVEGAVYMSEGDPMPGLPRPSVSLSYEDDATVHCDGRGLVWWDDGGCAFHTLVVRPNDKGRFRIAAAPSRLARIRTMPNPEMPSVAPVEQVVTAPCRVDLRVECTAWRVVVLSDGLPVADVTVVHGDASSKGFATTDRNGEVILMAARGRTYSVAVDVAGFEPLEIKIPADQDRHGPIVVELHRIHRAELRLLCPPTVSRLSLRMEAKSAGAAGISRRSVIRPDTQRPFVVKAKPGTYELHLGFARAGTDKSGFVLPMTTKVDLPVAGAELTLNLRFGGRLRIDVRGADGRRLAGAVSLIDVDGYEIVPRFWLNGDCGPIPGALLQAESSETFDVVATGRYLVSVKLGSGRQLSRWVEVAACEVTVVEFQDP